MPSTGASSSSSTEAGALGPASELAGFRIERLIGRGSRGTVYEATQVNLDRRVALKLLQPDAGVAERLGRLRWPEHRNVVSLYAAGTCLHGQYVAMQLVRGSTLAKLQTSGKLAPGRAIQVLNEVAMALDAAHLAGIVHGAVAAQNVFVEPSGRALVSDFGLGSEGATQDSDRAAFAALVRECLGDRLPAPVTPPPSSAAAIVGSAAGALPERRTPRWLWKAIVAVVAGAAALAATGVLLAGSEDEPEPAPPVLQGAQALGSALPATGVEPLDCNGRPPTGASPLCTLVQTRLPGRPVIPRRDGAIRRWTVRGARGVLALQVLRRRGGMFVSTARTRYEQIPDEGVHAFQADLPIREGDEVGVQVAPGAAIGVRRDVRGAQTARSFGPLTRTALPVERGERSGFGEEVLLRVEYLPGAEPDLPGRLTGRAAKQAPAGQQLAALDVKPPDGPVRRTSVVRVGDRIAVDLFQRERRITRLPVAGADARGRLLSVNTHGEPTVYLRWRNPDGRTISHDYAVSSRSMTPSS